MGVGTNVYAYTQYAAWLRNDADTDTYVHTIRTMNYFSLGANNGNKNSYEINVIYHDVLDSEKNV